MIVFPKKLHVRQRILQIISREKKQKKARVLRSNMKNAEVNTDFILLLIFYLASTPTAGGRRRGHALYVCPMYAIVQQNHSVYLRRVIPTHSAGVKFHRWQLFESHVARIRPRTVVSTSKTAKTRHDSTEGKPGSDARCYLQPTSGVALSFRLATAWSHNIITNSPPCGATVWANVECLGRFYQE